VFLHELGHSLGAMHVQSEDTIMNPFWSKDQKSFDKKNLEMIAVILRHRLLARRSKQFDPEMVDEIRALLDGPGWEHHARADLRDLRLRIARGVKSTTETRSAHYDVLREIENQHFDEAWRLLVPMLDRDASDPDLSELACAIASVRDGALADAKKYCDDRTGPLLNLARALIAAGETEEAEKTLASLRARCVEEQCELSELGQSAELHARAGMLARAEELAKTATVAEESIRALRHVKETRSRCRVTDVKAEVEAAQVRACDRILALLAKKDTKGALDLIESTGAKHGRTQFLHFAACKAHMLTFARAKAQKACAQAGEIGEAQFYLAVLANLSGNTGRAIGYAERAKTLDPDFQSSWSFLAGEYRRARKTAELDALAAEFLARFGRPLPD
jgi:tetratricopeptide (TPR) repeat protein